jgi:DNA anti-recombination protein RmuC
MKLGITLWLTMLTILAAMLLVGACDNEEQTATDELAQERRQLREDLEDAAEKLDKRIDELEADLEQAGDDASEQKEQTVQALKEMRKRVDDRLNKLGNTAEEQWDEFSSDVNSVLNEIDRELSQ